jgi:putative transposase
MNVEFKYHRHSIRLKHYDYAIPGGYFITICAHNRDCLFGSPVGANGVRPVSGDSDPQIILNEYGKIVREEWLKTIDIRHEIALDEFVVMPNHFHAIVFICRGDRLVAPIPTSSSAALTSSPVRRGERPLAPAGPAPKSIGALMTGYKSAVTKRINMLRRTPGYPVWQRNYYEHIIRNEKELNEIREYIILNPVNWEKDTEFIPFVGATGRSPLP